MRTLPFLMLLAVAACRHGGTPANFPSAEPSTYAGLETREIKALSADQIRGYLDGAGLGYALAAELNGYPGPRHVLDLADSLMLTGDQRERVEQSFRKMQANARELGREFVAAEAALDEAFSSGKVDDEAIRELTATAAEIEGRIRAAHLIAHLQTAAVLTAHQIAMYNRLRGYDRPHVNDHHHEHQH